MNIPSHIYSIKPHISQISDMCPCHGNSIKKKKKKKKKKKIHS